jgi:hypothetical protein
MVNIEISLVFITSFRVHTIRFFWPSVNKPISWIGRGQGYWFSTDPTHYMVCSDAAMGMPGSPRQIVELQSRTIN